jgi:hypothetical protein
VNLTKEPVVMIQAQASTTLSDNLVVLLELDQQVQTFFGDNQMDAQSQNLKTFVVEKKDVEKDDLEK